MLRFQPGSALPPPRHERIRQFEEDQGIRLPRNFVDLLMHANGSVPIDRTFAQGTRERLIERWLCLLDDFENHPAGDHDMEVVLSLVGERLVDDGDTVGSDVIPIADLFAGDLVCLDYRENRDEPRVVVWDHEQSETFSPRLEVVAPSFRAFLEMLRP